MSADEATISEKNFFEAIGQLRGWCVECKKFTRANVVLDAVDFRCPKCGKDTVFGAQLAFDSQFFEVRE